MFVLGERTLRIRLGVCENTDLEKVAGRCPPQSFEHRVGGVVLNNASVLIYHTQG